MTNNQLQEQSRAYIHNLPTGPNEWDEGGGFTVDMSEEIYKAGFLHLADLITNHLKSLPLDQMTGKQVEESLWNEFLHIQ